MSEKTEKPTAKKLRDARKKGQVAKSREISSAAVLIGIFAVIWGGWDFFMEHFQRLVLLPTHFEGQPFEQALLPLFHGVLYELTILSLAALGPALVLAIAGNFFQIGFLFAPQMIKPEFKKLNPAQGFKKIFSMQNVFEFIKSAIKVLFLSVLLYLVLREAVDPLLKIPQFGMTGVTGVLGAIMKQVVIATAIAFITIAAVDFYLQQYQHTKKLKMSKDEVKREYKEMEGDPLIKGKRKQLHQELAMNNQAERARDAQVVVTNPTHFAVALFYEKDKVPLPVVRTKGEGQLAQRIVAVARQEGIPILRQVGLARSLYARVETDHYIPSDLIRPVAEVLRWVATWEQASREGNPPPEPIEVEQL